MKTYIKILNLVKVSAQRTIKDIRGKNIYKLIGRASIAIWQYCMYCSFLLKFFWKLAAPGRKAPEALAARASYQFQEIQCLYYF